MRVAVVSAVLLSTLLVGCQSFKQTADEVYVRPPGGLLLGNPTSVSDQAARDLPFAQLSDAAYGNTQAGLQAKSKNEEGYGEDAPSTCPTSQDALRLAGWEPWQGFPDAELVSQFKKTDLRIEVWVRKAAPFPMIAVAFAGTDFKNPKHWEANLRWFFLTRNDQYSQVQEVLGPAFVKEYERRMIEPGWEFLKNATIFSTGHSLGGGLAQKFAYSLPLGRGVPRVSKVVVFNTSPVTAFSDVEESLRDQNSEGLVIDRIYERGEILASLRSLATLFYKPTETRPAIRALRYSLFYPSFPIRGHMIKPFTCKLHELAHPEQVQTELEELARSARH